MSIETIHTIGHVEGLLPAPAKSGTKDRPARPARRLPVQKDWPAWAILAVQMGILVVAIGGWEIAARLGLINAFFWSQPSAILRTLIIFFTDGEALTDISFTFRSTIFGFLIG